MREMVELADVKKRGKDTGRNQKESLQNEKKIYCRHFTTIDPHKT